ncbi:GNAT family acetyltransferase [Parablautia intestinalis]|uniref:GNAT family acetyltransferase n=1 Tax=Parablautia intestinalis TaxID=2320100 RepID=A0A3A9APB4_9FIRM|nr:GNAT family acetyltransferase [Parablautia intestinalis]RKI93119.1 GNAT family acetyltransferase [Parablautia intestinalis]
MLETNRYSVINIRRYLNSDNPKLGESRLLQVLSGFSCLRNPDVERFLKKSSVEFTKKNQSVTYLVFDISSMVLVGYFTLALKPLTVRGETVSNTVKKKLLRVSEWDEKSDTYTMSAYLIAQLGKNFTSGADQKITGEELLALAWDKIKEIQYLGGGVVTFLEAENEEKLLSFYRDNRFSQFDTRQTASDTDEAHELVQLLRLL